MSATTYPHILVRHLTSSASSGPVLPHFLGGCRDVSSPNLVEHRHTRRMLQAKCIRSPAMLVKTNVQVKGSRYLQS